MDAAYIENMISKLNGVNRFAADIANAGESLNRLAQGFNGLALQLNKISRAGAAGAGQAQGGQPAEVAVKAVESGYDVVNYLKKIVPYNFHSDMLWVMKTINESIKAIKPPSGDTVKISVTAVESVSSITKVMEKHCKCNKNKSEKPPSQSDVQYNNSPQNTINNYAAGGEKEDKIKSAVDGFFDIASKIQQVKDLFDLYKGLSSKGTPESGTGSTVIKEVEELLTKTTSSERTVKMTEEFSAAVSRNMNGNSVREGLAGGMKISRTEEVKTMETLTKSTRYLEVEAAEKNLAKAGEKAIGKGILGKIIPKGLVGEVAEKGLLKAGLKIGARFLGPVGAVLTAVDAANMIDTIFFDNKGKKALSKGWNSIKAKASNFLGLSSDADSVQSNADAAVQGPPGTISQAAGSNSIINNFYDQRHITYTIQSLDPRQIIDAIRKYDNTKYEGSRRPAKRLVGALEEY